MHRRQCKAGPQKNHRFLSIFGIEANSFDAQDIEAGNSIEAGKRIASHKGGRGHKGRRLGTTLVSVACSVGIAIAIAVSGTGCGPASESAGSDDVLTSIAEANGGELPDIYLDKARSSIHYIDGRYTTRIINNSEDAVASIGDIAALYGIDDPAVELREHSTDALDGTTFYRLQQYRNDVAVYGNQLIVAVDDGGNAESISGLYDDDVSDASEPTIDEFEAQQVAAEAGYRPIGGTALSYYSETGRSSQLCWLVECAGERVFVDASDGRIAGIESTVYTESALGHGNDLQGDYKPFKTSKTASSTYDLLCEEYNIAAYDLAGTQIDDAYHYARVKFLDAAGNELVVYDPYSWDAEKRAYTQVYSWKANVEQPEHWNWVVTTSTRGSIAETSYGIQDLDTESLIIENLSYEMVPYFKDGTAVPVTNDGDNLWTDPDAVSAMANIQWAYQAYSDLGRRGYDGSGSPRLSVWYNLNWNNARSDCDGSIILFGKNWPTLEIAVHEYTHSVENQISSMRCLRETGALAEAYSDIMALTLTDSSTWTMGSMRNPSNPHAKKNPSYYKGAYWDSRFESMSDEEIMSDGNDNGGVHKHSTVISHAAYLMHKAGISSEDLARIWYRSFYHLDPNSDFYTCRYAVLASARELGFKDNVLKIIEDAFDAVGIRRFDVSAMTVAPDGKIYAEDEDGNRLEEFSVQLCYTGSESGKPQGGFAYTANTTDGCIDMKTAFGKEPLAGYYFIQAGAKGAEQDISPVIHIDPNGAKELVVTLPVLVIYLDKNSDDLRNEAYLDKVNEYKAAYGEGRAEMVSNGSVEQLKGLCLVVLIDFDKDGNDELLLGYYDEGRETYSANDGFADAQAYRAEVWGYVNGLVTKLYESDFQWTNGGFAYLPVYYRDNDVAMHTIEYGTDEDGRSVGTNKIWVLQDDEFKPITTFSTHGLWGTGTVEYEIDGKVVGEDTFKSHFNSVMGDCTQVSYWMTWNDSSSHEGERWDAIYDPDATLSMMNETIGQLSDDGD